MKKSVSLILLMLMPFIAFSQRIAVLEFKPGVGVSLNDVDGLSSIFVTYFAPEGYTLVERSQIDRVIDEQNFQRSSLSDQQMVQVGKILNLSKIVVGNVNVVMGEYNVDVRVINVESGTITATEGASFTQGSYRQGMKNIAMNLSDKIANKPSIIVNRIPEDGKLPASIINRMSKQPKKLTTAIIADQNLYFADSEVLQLIKSLPYKPNLTIICVMVDGGEAAFGVGLQNRYEKIDATTAKEKFTLTRPYTLPDVSEGQMIFERLDGINLLLNLVDGEEMHSQYWTNHFANENGNIVSLRLDLSNTSDEFGYHRPNPRDLAYYRPIYKISSLRKMASGY